MQADYLLTDSFAAQLYHDSVKDLPILDFHNHLSPGSILDNTPYRDITELWVRSDPYKHRAMRILGVPEERITGGSSPKEQFLTWWEALPHLVGNPLYQWSQMELSRVFGFDEPFRSVRGENAWQVLNDRLPSPRGLLDQFHVEYAAPCLSLTEDPSVFDGEPRLAPSMRVDELLQAICGPSLEAWEHELSQRLDGFDRAGCRFADHSLDAGFVYVPDDGKNEGRYSQLRAGQSLSAEDQLALQSHVLRIMAKAYTRRGWVMQLHMGALRYTSSRLRSLTGPAGGYAGMGSLDVENIVLLLNDLESRGSLPRTLLFPLNPAHYEALGVLSGSFVEAGIRGKVQLGPAWWWCDHQRDITQVLETVSAYGVLDVFMGMTTDSRSLLSLSRHDYFRRILCSWMGRKVQKGHFPRDMELLSEIAQNICYKNIKEVLSHEG